MQITRLWALRADTPDGRTLHHIGGSASLPGEVSTTFGDWLPNDVNAFAGGSGTGKPALLSPPAGFRDAARPTVWVGSARRRSTINRAVDVDEALRVLEDGFRAAPPGHPG